MKSTTPVIPKTKRHRNWILDTDKYDSDTANEDISKQEHIRPNSDMFNSPFTTPIYSYHTQSNLQGNFGHTKHIEP